MNANGAQAGKVVVITGATSGVGRATAVEFAELGWRVALLARGADGLEAAAKDVDEYGGIPLPIPTDVSSADEVEAAAEEVEARLGPIDVLVNDAMTTVFSPVVDMTPDDYKRVTDVTYLGFVYGTLAALKRMRSARSRGLLSRSVSALAYRSIPLQSAYRGAKHAMSASRSLCEPSCSTTRAASGSPRSISPR